MVVCMETRSLMLVVGYVVYVVRACMDTPLSQPIVPAS